MEDKNLSRHKKIKHLEGYRWAQNNIDLLNDQIKDIDLQLQSVKSPIITDMPRGGVPKDETDLVDQKIMLEGWRDNAKEKRYAVANSIKQVKDPKHVLVLRLKYISGKTISEISVMLGYSYKHTCTMHTEAVDAVSWRTIY